VVAVLAGGLAGSVSLVWALAADRPAKEAGSDKDRLQGSWQILDAEFSGKKAEGEEGDRIKQQKLVIKGTTLTLKSACEFTLAEKATPPEINLEVTEGPELEKGTWRGIYQLKGDDLKICISLPGADRPKEFATKEGVLSMLVTLKRVKD
jgi:uncharacterized protein (TIGR03067 family)